MPVEPERADTQSARRQTLEKNTHTHTHAYTHTRTLTHTFLAHTHTHTNTERPAGTHCFYQSTGCKRKKKGGSEW